MFLFNFINHLFVIQNSFNYYFSFKICFCYYFLTILTFFNFNYQNLLYKLTIY